MLLANVNYLNKTYSFSVMSFHNRKENSMKPLGNDGGTIY